MATATMATAIGAAAVFYYSLKRRMSENGSGEQSQEGVGVNDPNSASTTARVRLGLARHAPSTWFEAIATLSETLRFTYSETLGKWPIVDLAFGINFLMKRQGQLQAASIYAGEGTQELKGVEILAELKELIHLITACIHFSKKPFPQFLEATGYSLECVLLQEAKAGLLKPAFTILVDEKVQCILLLIRGTHSVKDTLTAVTGAIVPFHHTLLDEDGISNIVLGYAHCGMVAAARWIAQLAIPVLLQAQKDHPTYNLKIVGHSLGGGTAALLTYILRERREFSSATCICFAPAACMTWELAESGRPFTTSVVNGSDIVPTFSAASMDDLRAEVTASAWINDLREQIERVKILKAVMHSTSALGSRISSISRPLYPYLEDAAKAGAATWRPVSSGTQVVMRHAQNAVKSVVKTPQSFVLAGWSCMGARRRLVASHSSLDSGFEKLENNVIEKTEVLTSSDWSNTEIRHGFTGSNVGTYHGDQMSEWSSTEIRHGFTDSSVSNYHVNQGSYSVARVHDPHEQQSDDDDDDDDEGLPLSRSNHFPELTEEYLLQHLEHELDRQRETSITEREEEEEVAKKLTQEEEEEVAAKTAKVGSDCIVTDSRTQGRELNRFFPPGRIIHLLSIETDVNIIEGTNTSVCEGRSVRAGLFITDRALYGNVHLSRTMINDHYMPNYRRMMESVVKDIEQNASLGVHN